LEIADKALYFYISIDDKLNIVNSYNLIGSIYYLKKEYEKSLENYLRSLEFAEGINYEKGISNANKNIGDLYYDKDENEKALEYYQKSQEVNEKYNYLNEHDREKLGLRINVIKKNLDIMRILILILHMMRKKKGGSLAFRGKPLIGI